MQTLHIVSHTHWDREWYRPFQSFRLRLVHLIDNLLDILASDSEFKYFMLDGQTIVLDDYLQVRPEREEILREYVQAGRLLVGPWHILPDEFLVSPEATIRNLLKGGQTASRLGHRMSIGYTPDPFGHIAQLPQILSGFGIQSACLQRGLSVEPVELWWDAPDGSRVFLAYLREGYGNGSILTFNDLEQSVVHLKRIRESLAPQAHTSQLLVMQGTDHMEPAASTPAGIVFANQHLDGARVVHSTLPGYLAAVQNEIERDLASIPVVSGELRSPRRHPLLPGVLSARIWIKQRNHACQQLLERWAEPFSTLASLVLSHLPPDAGAQQAWTERIDHPADLLQTAWNLLMECHPHDSISGCSIDQVHAEMLPRFDQVEQIASEVALQNLQVLANRVQTTHPDWGKPVQQAIVVFNPSQHVRTDQVEVAFQIPGKFGNIEIIDETGRSLPFQVIRIEQASEVSFNYPRTEFLGMIWLLESGEYPGSIIDHISVELKGMDLWLEIERKNSGAPNKTEIKKALADIANFLENPDLDIFHIRVITPATLQVRFIAPEVPGIGYRTFWVRPGVDQSMPHRVEATGNLENEFFQLRANREDGTLTVLDKQTGIVYEGLNHFVDGGDSGDEYNYNPPATDRFVSPRVTAIRTEDTAGIQSLEISLEIDLPVSLTADRQARSNETILQEITTRIRLFPGVRRIDIRTEVENQARDHRLRVHFPAPFSVDFADYDGHFEVRRRPVAAEEADASWIEQPRPEKPQRMFTDITDGNAGLMISNRGLPEIEVGSSDGGSSWLALTLLRCVGWLSRGDLRARKGDAGPSLPAPEAQLPGRWTFDYAIIPHPGSWQAAFAQAYAFNDPLWGIPAGIYPGSLPSKASLVSVQPETFAVSAIKPAQDGNGWILRGTNLLTTPIQVELSSIFPLGKVFRARMDETNLEPLPLDEDGRVHVTVRGCEILTLRFAGTEL